MSTNQSHSNRFDWESAKLRLRSVQAAISICDDLSSADSNRVLMQRAERLARIPEPPLDTSQILEVVRFQLGNESYAIATSFVLELTRKTLLTSIPQTKGHFLGVTNLRGEITLVIDLALYLGISVEQQERDQLLVLGTARPEIAIIVDSMDHVMTLPRATLMEPAAVAGGHRELMLGCTSQGMLVFDGEALLGCQELYLDQSD